MKNLVVSKTAALASAAREYISSELVKEKLNDIQSCHGDMLHYVLHYPGIAVGELSKRCHRSKSTVSKLSDKLETLGYIRKEKSDKDPRITCLYPTDKCREIELSFNAIGDRLSQKIATKLDEDEIELLEALLDKALEGFIKDN